MSGTTNPPQNASSAPHHEKQSVIASFIQVLAGGTLAGFLTELVLYPVEGPLVDQKPIQVQPTGSAASASPAQKPTMLRSPMAALRYHLGISPSISLSSMSLSILKTCAVRAPGTGLLMASYEFARESFEHQLRRTGWVGYGWAVAFYAGLGATLVEATLLAPMVSIREALDLAKESGSAKTGVQVAVSACGPLPLMRQFSHIVVTTAPFVSMYYGFTDRYIAMLKSKYRSDLPPSFYNVVGGTLGGVTAILIATPLEFLRQRLITEWNMMRHTAEVVSKEGTSSAKAIIQERCRQEMRFKILHQTPRFAFRRAFYGTVKGAVFKMAKRTIRRIL
ncbi:uncharacterized protein BJ171DRAFT_488953 [Polychytrium aggregatum]|uniref:uncharacterized protein n=1 Tax=Polychytrium aggregatum TaxID=110093 RepID=UPI0022FDFBDA|nr:uncharacterized protein BJ171DRAFT_488953 [Polychytrium aggregatum]KAI9208469.1 hypothetical protein BJ171DRAFT_488953 [Polychytrium aggregatum]